MSQILDFFKVVMSGLSSAWVWLNSPLELLGFKPIELFGITAIAVVIGFKIVKLVL